MKTALRHLTAFATVALAILAVVTPPATLADSRLGYDPGPDPSTEVGRGYIELFKSIPNFELLGREMDEQGRSQFRYAFGPTFYRGRLQKNSVKVLVIGQDGTHIAEAAGRTFTGGTGGRLQHVLDYLGIEESYLFINTFSYTIYGQYADYAPVLVRNRSGQEQLQWRQVLTPRGYLLSQDPSSPIAVWRNHLIEHVIRSNPDSLKAIIAVGGAARDTLASFIRSRGGKVGTMLSEEQAKNVQMVAYGKAGAGGNRSFFFPVDAMGNNLLANEGERPRYNNVDTQNEHMERAKDPERLARLVKPTSGPYGNGILNLAQFGSDLEETEIGGVDSSLQGLMLSNGTKLTSDVRFIALPHPGAAGGVSGEERDRKLRMLEESFQKKLDLLTGFRAQGWDLPPDLGGTNRLFAGEKFRYGRAAIPEFDFPFGLTRRVIVDESIARRETPNIIEIGSRNAGSYADLDVERALRGSISGGGLMLAGEVPWEPSRIYAGQFDQGPGEWARLLSQGLDLRKIFAPKPGMSLRENGIDALNVKNYPDHGAVAPYRGTFESPEVLVLADPRDLDDFYAAVALAGRTGQRLQGFMTGLGVEEKYLVLKTVPFDMTGAKDSEWNATLANTREWRQTLVREVLSSGKTRLILTLGRWADAEMSAIATGEVPVVSLTRGYPAAFEAIQRLPGWASKPLEYVEQSMSIPRTHLPFGKQIWVGTSGNRVIRATGAGAGMQYQIVVPKWVTESAPPALNEAEQRYVESTRHLLIEQGFMPCPSLLRSKQSG